MSRRSELIEKREVAVEGRTCGEDTKRLLTNFIKIEWKLSRNRTIEPSLEKGGPVFVQNILATSVSLKWE